MFRRGNKPSECCRIFEHISRFDKAIDVLQEFKMYDEAVASLRRYKEKKVNISNFFASLLHANTARLVHVKICESWFLLLNTCYELQMQLFLLTFKICVLQKKALYKKKTETLRFLGN